MKDLVKHLLAKTIDDGTYKMMDEEFDREETGYLSKMAETQEAIIGAFYETSESNSRTGQERRNTLVFTFTRGAGTFS